jgi:hypothetical protein
MSLTKNSEIREVKGISDGDLQRIMAFLQGAVYCWCKNRKGDWFSLRDFLGGDNFFWQGTPLIALYDKHERMGKAPEDSVKCAGKDAGWILKRVLNDDKREFDAKDEEQINKYLWIGGHED